MGDQSGPIIENGGQNGDAGCSDTGPSSIVGVGPPSPLTGCYLLIVIGEPHSPEHKDIILQRLVKGFLSWDVSNCHVDLEEELNTITLHAPEGEEARHGERLIQYASENLVTEILIHPQFNTLIQCMRNLLSSFTRHRHIIHVGYTFAGNGSWILQDGTFSVADFAEAFQEHEVQRVLRAYPDTITMDIHCASAGLWTSLDDKNFAKSCKIRINPNDVLNSGSEKINTFIDYLTPMLVPASLTDLLESSDVVGNIRFSHPTLYVFPGGQGDAALFGINGFNMLVDGGFSRKACFWDFARHLDRLDAVLMTRVNNSNLSGLSSVVERKQNSNVYPQIGHFFCNIPDRKNLLSPDGDKDRDPLIIDLIEKGHHLVNNLKSLNLKPQICYRDTEPINLYHKVGHGTLDMYVLSPAKDSKEVKDFLAKWNAGDQKLFAPKDGKDFAFPIQNMVSVCALLVWQPANPEDPITRILFPGSTPDYKIIEGLEKIKRLDFMKYPVCSAKSIAPSISVSSITKKTIKSATSDKITPEPILPSKVTKSILPEKDNKIADNKMKNAQIDNKGKTEENEQNVIEEMKTEKQAIKSIAASRGDMKSRIVKDKQKIEPKKTDNRILDSEKKTSSDEYNGDKKAELDNVDNFDNKIEQETMNGEKIENEIEKTTKKEEAEIKAKSKLETKAKVEAKSKIDTKSSVKSRIDSKPPRSIERKQIKKDVSEKKDATKSSPSSTPKRTADKLANGVPKDKEVKPKISTRTTISSPSGTPAKSAKEANNRKVVESKQKNILASKREVSKTTEKKEIKEVKEVKTEKKPITRRPKTAGIPSKAPGSPLKAKKMAPLKNEKDYIIRKAKLEKGGTTDSSLVSTPSAEDSGIKKIVEMDSSQDIDVVKQRELDELKEEQEAVREIEAVFIRDQEKAISKTTSTEHRKVTEIVKQDSTTEAEEDDEYLIIEKEEQYTEDSINEQESSVTKEEEIQKHQRDSEESEKKRKGSKQVTEEEEVVEEPVYQNIVKKQDAQLDEPVVLEIIEGETKDKETKDEDEQEDMQPDSIEEKGNKMSADDKEDLENEVQEIISSAKEIAKAKTESREDSNLKTEDMSTPSPEDKISSAKKTTDTKDDLLDAAPEHEAREPLDGIMQTSQPDEKFSATIESGATTAPTLPEDERIPLDEIKEDLVIEEKYVKEDTKESDIPIKTVIMQPHEPVERIIPAKMHFDVKQSHLRDIVKTPDEVADLPVHEEADFGAYDEYQESKKPETKRITTKEPLPKELKTSPEAVSALVTDDKVDKAEKVMDETPAKSKDLPFEQIPTQKIDDETKPKTVISDKHSEQVIDEKIKPIIKDDEIKAAESMIQPPVIESDIVIKDIKKTEVSLKDAEIKSEIKKIDLDLDKMDQDYDHVAEEIIEPIHIKTTDRAYTPKDKNIVVPKKSEDDIIKDIESQLISDMIVMPDKSKKVAKMETPKDEKPSLTMEELAAKVEAADKAVVKIIEKTPTDEPDPKDVTTEIDDTADKLDDNAAHIDDGTPKVDDLQMGILGKIDTTIKSATVKVDDTITDVKGKLEETTGNIIKKAEETDKKIAAAIVDETKKIDEKISHFKDGIDKTVENLETEKNKIAAGIDDSVQQVKSGIAAGIDEVGKTAEKVKSDVEHKIEKTKDDIKTGADTIVNDILGTVESKATELTDAGDKLITKLDDKVHDVKEKVEKQAEEIQEKTKSGISSFFGGISQGIISGIDKYANKLDEKIKVGAESVESALQDVDKKIKQGTATVDSAIQGLADKTGKLVDDVNKDLQKDDEKVDDVTSSENNFDEKTDDDKEKKTLDDISNYLDRIVKDGQKDSDSKKPTFAAKVPPMFTSELRETHITTLDSPVNEVCRIDEIKTLEKLPEVAEELLESTSKSPIIVVADREETNLNDIKEEDEEDERYSPTRKDAKDTNIINERLEPSRSVSPRERTPEEVTKIVATVAEVLKSDKDITEIIPDFDEEELNKKLRLDSLTDDLDLLDGQDASTVQRMLVTASSEDGGEETEICPEGTIKFTCSPSPSALEMAEKSMHDMDDFENEQNLEESTQDHIHDENEADYDASKHDLEKSAQSSIDKSYNDKESSPVSIEEKEVHELPEKLHSKESHEDLIKTSSDKADQKSDEIHGKESAMTGKHEDIESRRESAYSAYSEKDYTKDESSLGIDDKDHSRSHSIVSHTSEKSIEDIQYDIELCEKKKIIDLESSSISKELNIKSEDVGVALKSEKDDHIIPHSAMEPKSSSSEAVDDVKLTTESSKSEKDKSSELKKSDDESIQSPEVTAIEKTHDEQKVDEVKITQSEEKEKQKTLESPITDNILDDMKGTIEPEKTEISKMLYSETTKADITSSAQKLDDIKFAEEPEKSKQDKSPSPDKKLDEKISHEPLKSEISKSPSPEPATAGIPLSTHNLIDENKSIGKSEIFETAKSLSPETHISGKISPDQKIDGESSAIEAEKTVQDKPSAPKMEDEVKATYESEKTTTPVPSDKASPVEKLDEVKSAIEQPKLEADKPLSFDQKSDIKASLAQEKTGVSKSPSPEPTIGGKFVPTEQIKEVKSIVDSELSEKNKSLSPDQKDAFETTLEPEKIEMSKSPSPEPTVAGKISPAEILNEVKTTVESDIMEADKSLSTEQKLDVKATLETEKSKTPSPEPAITDKASPTEQAKEVKSIVEPESSMKDKSLSPEQLKTNVEPEKSEISKSSSSEPTIEGKISPSEKLNEVKTTAETQKTEQKYDVKTTLEPEKSEISKSPSPEPTIVGKASPETTLKPEKSETSKSPSPEPIISGKLLPIEKIEDVKAEVEPEKTEILKSPLPDSISTGKASPANKLEEIKSIEEPEVQGKDKSSSPDLKEELKTTLDTEKIDMSKSSSPEPLIEGKISPAEKLNEIKPTVESQIKETDKSISSNQKLDVKASQELDKSEISKSSSPEPSITGKISPVEKSVDVKPSVDTEIVEAGKSILPDEKLDDKNTLEPEKAEISKSPESTIVDKMSPEEKLVEKKSAVETQKLKADKPLSSDQKIDLKTTLEPEKSELSKSPSPEPIIAGKTSDEEKQKLDADKSLLPDQKIDDKTTLEQNKSELSKSPSPEPMIAGKLSLTEKLEDVKGTLESEKTEITKSSTPEPTLTGKTSPAEILNEIKSSLEHGKIDKDDYLSSNQKEEVKSTLESEMSKSSTPELMIAGKISPVDKVGDCESTLESDKAMISKSSSPEPKVTDRALSAEKLTEVQSEKDKTPSPEQKLFEDKSALELEKSEISKSPSPVAPSAGKLSPVEKLEEIKATTEPEKSAKISAKLEQLSSSDKKMEDTLIDGVKSPEQVIEKTQSISELSKSPMPEPILAGMTSTIHKHEEVKTIEESELLKSLSHDPKEDIKQSSDQQKSEISKTPSPISETTITDKALAEEKTSDPKLVLQTEKSDTSKSHSPDVTVSGKISPEQKIEEIKSSMAPKTSSDENVDSIKLTLDSEISESVKSTTVDTTIINKISPLDKSDNIKAAMSLQSQEEDKSPDENDSKEVTPDKKPVAIKCSFEFSEPGKYKSVTSEETVSVLDSIWDDTKVTEKVSTEQHIDEIVQSKDGIKSVMDQIWDKPHEDQTKIHKDDDQKGSTQSSHLEEATEHSSHDEELNNTEKKISTTQNEFDLFKSSIIHGEPLLKKKTFIEKSSMSVDKDEDFDEKIVSKETRSKSVSAIMVGSIYGDHGSFNKLSALDENTDYSKDDSELFTRQVSETSTSSKSNKLTEKNEFSETKIHKKEEWIETDRISISPENEVCGFISPDLSGSKRSSTSSLDKSVLKDEILSDTKKETVTSQVTTEKKDTVKTEVKEILTDSSSSKLLSLSTKEQIKTSTEDLNLSGKSTPDIAEVETKTLTKVKTELSGKITPPTVPVSPSVKSDFPVTQEPIMKSEFPVYIQEGPGFSGISTPKDLSGMSSPGLASVQTNSDSASKSVTTSFEHHSGVETSDSSPKPTSPFPKGLGAIKSEELKTSSGMSTPDMTRMSTPDIMETKTTETSKDSDLGTTTTTTTTTTITKPTGDGETSTKTVIESKTTKTESSSSSAEDRPTSKSEVSSSESQSQQTFKETLPMTSHPLLSKDIINLKSSEVRSYTPVSDDYEIHEVSSPRSDISSGQQSRVVAGWAAGSSEERHYSDDEMPESPLSITSQAAHSPTSKFVYEADFDLKRSGSGVSKKSDYEIDDSQDDIPPQYGSEEIQSARSITSTYKPDPMSTSFYGALPEMSGKSEPIPISSTKTTEASVPGSDHFQTSYMKSTSHKFLDEADLDFEKALEEHIQVRGTEVMTSIQSKYEYPPKSQPDANQSFPLDEINKAKAAALEIKEKAESSAPLSSTQGTSNTTTTTTTTTETVKDPISSWGKPLGLPSPAPAPTENEMKTTPKRERKLIISKTKINNEKNLRKRSESPAKGKKAAPIYIDLTYVPHHGNSYYSHVEFFKRVRARYYVFSGTEPSREVYNALLEAKQTWEDKDLEVTIIPTYDTDVLGYWVSENEDLLAKYHIDLSPSASRCTINLQDHETSCSAYRLEF